jgi:predicted  nucleic acid-binding Zn-ribbon protein
MRFKIFDNLYKDYKINDDDVSLNVRIQKLEEKCEKLSNEIEDLKEDNMEINNLLRQLMNNIDAVDARIDILTLQSWTLKKVEQDTL